MGYNRVAIQRVVTVPEEPRNRNDNYEQLRQWFLARQRQLAQEEATKTMATPASRIASDKKAIRQLVESAALPDQDENASTKHFGLAHVAIAWIVFQLISVCILAFHENSISMALGRFVDLTFMSLVPHSTFTPIDNFVDKLCFLAFFILPGIILLLLPGAPLNFSLTAKPTLMSKISSSKASLICLSLIFVLATVLFLLNSSATTGPEALTLTKEAVEGPERCFFAWTSLLLLIPIAHLKSSLKATESTSNKLLRIHADITGQAEQDSAGVEQALSRLQQAVQELLQRERAIADFSKTVIVCFSKELKIEAISMSCLAQWGYHQHELIGLSFEQIMFHEDYTSFAESVHASRGSLEQYARIRKGDNTIMDCFWFIDWSSQFGRYFASCEDITDRMNLERARNDFIAQLTHDMRSPLSGVSMSLDLISDKVYGELPTSLLHSVELSKKSLSRVLQLITDILDAERLRHSNQALSSQKVDLVQLVRLSFEELNSVAIEKQVRLLLNCSNEPLYVKADPKLLSRVLANLLNNALSFSPKGGSLKVEVSISSDSALLKVMDQGPGIHQDYHRVIFERFGAPKILSEENRTSTGIGLSICRDVIIAHGGLIGVESEPGKGSIFWFTLPIERKS